MKKRICFILAILLGATLMLTACNGWRKYSLRYQTGLFTVGNLTENEIFTADSKIEIALVDQSEKLSEEYPEAFIVELPGTLVCFVFRNLAAGVEKIEYSYTKERSDTYAVYLQDDRELSFTLYSYDWSDKIYVMGTDIRFDSLDREIKATRLKQLPDNYTEKNLILEYIADFGDAYAVRITDNLYTTSPTPVWFESKRDPLLISGVIFDSAVDYVVYYDGAFWSIRDAFNNKLFAIEDLLTLQAKRKAEEPSLYQEYEKTTQEIASAYDAKHESTWNTVTSIFYYFYGGKDNGTYVTMIYTRETSEGTAITEFTVDGVYFQFSTTHVFDVYHDGEFYTLQEAFDNGFLTHDDLLTTQENWSDRKF